MQQYQNDGGTSSGSKAKRAGGVLTATLRVDLENLHGDFSMLKVIQASIRMNLPLAIDETFRSLPNFVLYLVNI
jgi:hypothetical protein